MTVYVFARQMAGYRDIRLIWKLRASIFGVVPGRTTRLVRQTGLDGDAIVHTAARDDAASNECALATPGPSGPFLWAIAQYGVRTKKRLTGKQTMGLDVGQAAAQNWSEVLTRQWVHPWKTNGGPAAAGDPL